MLEIDTAEVAVQRRTDAGDWYGYAQYGWMDIDTTEVAVYGMGVVD